MIQPEQWARFITQISHAGNIGAACAASRISRSAFYQRKKQDPDFYAEFSDALESAMDRMEGAAWTRAVDGVERPTPSGPVRDYSDALLMFLLKAHRPAKYRDQIRHELTGPDGQPLAPSVVIVPPVSQGDEE